MKKLIYLAVAALMVGSTSCNNKLKETEARNAQLEGDVSQLVATQDSLLVLVNDITEGMSQIKDLEQIISTPGALDSETPSRREQIKNDMIAIRQALQERRQRLDELEKRLSASGSENATLKKTIASLQSQIAEQQTEIAQLTNQLAAANIQIKELETSVSEQREQIDNLNAAVDAESRERQIAQAESEKATQELNTCYYCLGTQSELKKNGVIESGFLRKTKIMNGDYNLGYFTRADKRTLTTINTHSRKAQVMTNMPKDSYTITDVAGEKVITITNPARFWSLSNFLVIKIG